MQAPGVLGPRIQFNHCKGKRDEADLWDAAVLLPRLDLPVAVDVPLLLANLAFADGAIAGVKAIDGLDVTKIPSTAIKTVTKRFEFKINAAQANTCVSRLQDEPWSSGTVNRLFNRLRRCDFRRGAAAL